MWEDQEGCWENLLLIGVLRNQTETISAALENADADVNARVLQGSDGTLEERYQRSVDHPDANESDYFFGSLLLQMEQLSYEDEELAAALEDLAEDRTKISIDDEGHSISAVDLIIELHGLSALEIAVRLGHIDAAWSVIEHGANTDALLESLDDCDSRDDCDLTEKTARGMIISKRVLMFQHLVATNEGNATLDADSPPFMRSLLAMPEGLVGMILSRVRV